MKKIHSVVIILEYRYNYFKNVVDSISANLVVMELIILDYYYVNFEINFKIISNNFYFYDSI